MFYTWSLVVKCCDDSKVKMRLFIQRWQLFPKWLLLNDYFSDNEGEKQLSWLYVFFLQSNHNLSISLMSWKLKQKQHHEFYLLKVLIQHCSQYIYYVKNPQSFIFFNFCCFLLKVFYDCFILKFKSAQTLYCWYLFTM